jgi:PelA/Pel-15E family pectate lyase
MRQMRMARSTLLAVMAAVSAVSYSAPATRDDILATMKRATEFMANKVALRGGYVWLVSEDLSRRWGEIPARPSQIWLQGGTERMGELFLDAHQATGDIYYLQQARKAADALVFGQRPQGGWHYFIDFEPAGIAGWYESTASRFRWGYEEYRHYYGNATFDDQVTPDAARYLLRFYRVTHEAAYREPVLKALDFVLQAQFPNGAWPQRFPLRHEYAHDGLPDYTSFYTLNDGATAAIIELLIDGWETMGDQRYLDAARRGVDALVAMQGPAGQAAWGEQHGRNLRPIAARTHEPAGYVVRESRFAIRTLQEFYLLTGEARYLGPVPRCLDWFDRVNREIAAQKYPAPRYWEPGSNKPLYVVRTDKVNADGYGLYLWTTDPARTRCDGGPCRGDGKPLINVDALRAEHQEVSSLASPGARAAQLARMRQRRLPVNPPAERIAAILGQLDERGAWITADNSVPVPNATSDDTSRETVRGISTQVFVVNMSFLVAALRDASER